MSCKPALRSKADKVTKSTLLQILFSMTDWNFYVGINLKYYTFKDMFYELPLQDTAKFDEQ
jgi:hypothetical protein